MARQMSLVGFMQAGSTSVYAGSWRHPATEHGFLTGGFYEKLGRTLEEGCFDMMFFDDRLAMPGIYGGSVADAVRLGARPVKLDLSIVLGIVAAEYVLGWLPRGTHDWRRFLRPAELSRALRTAGLRPCHLAGIAYDPGRDSFALQRAPTTNYLMAATPDGR